MQKDRAGRAAFLQPILGRSQHEALGGSGYYLRMKQLFHRA